MSEDSIILLIILAMFFGCVILLYWIYCKYDNHGNIDIKDLENYVQWKKEIKYKPNKDM